MSCNQFNELMDKHLLGESSAAEEERLIKHSKECEECAALLSFSSSIDSEIEHFGENAVDDEYWSTFADRVHQGLAATPTAQETFFQRLWRNLGVPGLRPAVITAALTVCFLTCSPENPDKVVHHQTGAAEPTTVIPKSTSKHPKNEPIMPKMKTFSAQDDKGEELMAMSFSVGNVQVYWVINKDS